MILAILGFVCVLGCALAYLHLAAVLALVVSVSPRPSCGRWRP